MLDTTILIRTETRKLLRELGKKGETYDEVINELAKKAGPRKEESS
jgi:hypothetical protein